LPCENDLTAAGRTGVLIIPELDGLPRDNARGCSRSKIQQHRVVLCDEQTKCGRFRRSDAGPVTAETWADQTAEAAGS
jgi:hypothetical protein